MLTRIMARIAASRLSKWAEDTGQLSETQYGFRRGRGTEDAIHVIRRVYEEAEDRAHEVQTQDKPMAGLMDLRKAYPTTQRDTMWELLRRKGIAPNGNMMRTLKGMHEKTEYACRVGKELSERYRPRRGLREGCPSSPILFNILHDESIRHAIRTRKRNAEEHGLEGIGLEWKWRKKSRLTYQQKTKRNAHEAETTILDRVLFADDTTMLGKKRELQDCGGMDVSAQAMKDFGQTENEDKREWIVMGEPGTVRVLGAYMDLKVDTDKRVRRGYGAWALLKTRLKKSKLSVKRQAQIIRATVMTTMTHAAKSRPWREYEYRALQKVLDRAYRYITKTNLWKLTEEQKNMFDVRKECGAVRVKHEIEKMALEWCGHVLRMKEESLVKQTTKGWLNNKDSKLGKI